MALDTTVSSRLTYKAPSPLSLSSFPAARGALLRAACVPPPRGAPFRTWHADVVGDPALVFGAMLEAGIIIMLVQLGGGGGAGTIQQAWAPAGPGAAPAPPGSRGACKARPRPVSARGIGGWKAPERGAGRAP